MIDLRGNDRFEWELAPFRETFLATLTDPQDAAALRRLGRLAYDLTLNWMHFPPPVEPVTIAELRAVAEDLRYLSNVLAQTVAQGDGSGGDAVHERALAVRAAGWAACLSAIVAEIEGAIAGRQNGPKVLP